MDKKRVVVTGIGLVSAFGSDNRKFFESIRDGKSGVRMIEGWDASAYETITINGETTKHEFRTRFAAEVSDYDPTPYVDVKDLKRLDPVTHFAVTAGQLAVKDSGLDISGDLAEDTAVIIGSGIGGLLTIFDNTIQLGTKGPRRISPFFIPGSITDISAGVVSMYTGAKGPNYAVVSACATATHALGDAFKTIQRGDATAVIAGGTEKAVTPMGVGGFSVMKAISERNDSPETASRPFDKTRDGFVMGDGSAIMVLEELDHAMARGAKIYGEIVGYGATGDAFHLTMPAPDGEGAVRCMRRAIGDAGIEPGDIDYVNAHGTSTPYNDKTETIALKTVFGDHAYKLAVSSTKSQVGHLLGASGGMELSAVLLCMQEGIIPPTINYSEPDPDCDLDIVPNESRDMRVNYVLKNSFGFGGHNACLVVKRFDG